MAEQFLDLEVDAETVENWKKILRALMLDENFKRDSAAA